MNVYQKQFLLINVKLRHSNDNNKHINQARDPIRKRNPNLQNSEKRHYSSREEQSSQRYY